MAGGFFNAFLFSICGCVESGLVNETDRFGHLGRVFLIKGGGWDGGAQEEEEEEDRH